MYRTLNDYRYRFIGIIILLLVSTSLINTAFAQTDSLRSDVVGVYIIMPLDFPITDRTALNKSLNSFGLPSAIHPAVNAGIGLQLYANRYFLTIAYNQGTREKEEDNFLTEVEYRSTSFNVGYSLTKSHRFSVYPYTGIKFTGLNYLYREKVAAEMDFEEYFEQDLRHLELNNSRAHLDLGFGISGQWFYLINARAGYLVPIEKAKWTINNAKTDLTNGPTPDYKFYISLIIGLGNLYSDEMERVHNRRSGH